MEEKTDAIVLRSVDYRDNDRILTLFTADRGKITASMKGVRKKEAKLRFASELFSFSEYVFAVKGGRNTVVSASLYDGFFPLRESIGKFYAACCVAEICDLLLPEGVEGGSFFIDAVNAVKSVCYGDERQALAVFLGKAIRFAGFTLDLSACGSCGRRIRSPKKVYFDFSTGRFSCAECMQGTAASGCTYEYLKKCEGDSYDEALLSDDAVKRSIRLLKTYFCAKTESELSSLNEYIKIMD